ncbi:MAG: flagellar motor switch protein FliN [Acidobacteriota bacterium]|nr:flagellar motor switch protein FliN [Acidobacteriota bacterium]
MPEVLQEQQKLEQWLVKEWANRLAEVVASMTGVVPEIRHQPITAAADLAGAHRLWWRQPLSYPAEAALWVGGERQSWEEVGRRVLAAAGIDNATPENQRGTFQEVLIQALASLAQALSSRLRKQIGCKDGAESPLAEEASAGSSVVLVFDGSEVPFYLMFAPAVISDLLQGLDKPEKQDSKSSAVEKKARDRALAASSESSPSVESHAGGMDLLLDVELPVSVSFGRAQLPLKEVVKLTTGSIVELNRTVSEPVELIVNNCVIARGQVVVVEGNFGIRIDHVISRQERLRTLK